MIFELAAVSVTGTVALLVPSRPLDVAAENAIVGGLSSS